MQHPISRENLERFTAGKASPSENRAIVAHLLKGCADCARTLKELEHADTPVCAYDKVLDRFERNLRRGGRAGKPEGRFPGLALLSL